MLLLFNRTYIIAYYTQHVYKYIFLLLLWINFKHVDIGIDLPVSHFNCTIIRDHGDLAQYYLQVLEFICIYG